MLVIDTNVTLSALVSSQGYSFKLFKLMMDQKVDYLMNVKLLAEYWQLVTRKDNLIKIPLSLEEIETVMALLVQHGTYQETYFRWRPNLKDENDNFLMELAIAGNAESIVTFNKKDFYEAELKFNIRIETPKEFLKRRRLA